MKKRYALVVVLTLIAGMISGSANGAQLPGAQPVVKGPSNPYWPHASQTGITWMESGKRSGEHVYFKRFGGVRVRVDHGNWHGAMGSFADTRHIVYQEWKYTGRGAYSQIASFDTKTGRRHVFPAPVSTVAWEYWPVASGESLLFGRCRLDQKGHCRNGSRSLLLYDPNVPDHHIRALLDHVKDRVSFTPGYLGPRYAAWTECTRRGCVVKYYDRQTRRTHTVKANRFDVYAPAIDEEGGRLYFARDRHGVCGVHASLRVVDLGANKSRQVLALPRGVDSGLVMSLATNKKGNLDLYFGGADISRNCKRWTSDIYVVRDVDLR